MFETKLATVSFHGCGASPEVAVLFGLLFVHVNCRTKVGKTFGRELVKRAVAVAVAGVLRVVRLSFLGLLSCKSTNSACACAFGTSEQAAFAISHRRHCCCSCCCNLFTLDSPPPPIPVPIPKIRTPLFALLPSDVNPPSFLSDLLYHQKTHATSLHFLTPGNSSRRQSRSRRRCRSSSSCSHRERGVGGNGRGRRRCRDGGRDRRHGIRRRD